jgi:uncharacterized repeat protein (TIGR01451 family)
MSRLENDANVHSSTVSTISAPEVKTPIICVRPASMNLSLSEKNIWGTANRDSSDVVAAIFDSLGTAIPDGVPVTFSTTLGFFDNGTKTISTVTSGGSAAVYLVSENVLNVVKKGVVTAVAGVAQSGMITGTVPVLMYPGAVTGVVRATVRVGSNIQQVPYKGAIADVFDNVPQIVGSDTTGNDGVFFISLNKETMMYTLKIFVVDEFGDTLSTATGMSSDTLFNRKAVTILNTVAGRLQYATINSPISVAGVAVYLDSLSLISTGRTASGKTQRVSAPFVRSLIQTTMTDALGRFKFQNLQPAIYEVTVDSVKFPNYSGETTVYDSLDGTFTINLNILVRPTVSLGLSMSAQPTVSAGDTVKYSIKYQNQGNIYQSNAVMLDTLPRYTSLVASPKGSFKAVTLDTTQRIVRWTMDSLATGISDSVGLMLAVSRNIPDSTSILNRTWFSSSQLASQSTQTLTLVRSAPLITMGNYVLQNKDSVVAGDSVQFEIWYRNAGTDSLRGVKIVDSIFNAGRSVLRYNHWSASKPGNDTTVVDSAVVWNIGSIAPGKVDSLMLYMRTDYTLATGRKIQTTASILQNGLAVRSSSASVLLKSNPQFSTFLQVVKSADKNVAEIGDVVTYQVTITNNSNPPELMKGLKITDQLPHAFKYYARSARYNGIPVEPQSLSNGTILQWTLASVARDTLRLGNPGTLVYQLVLGADAMESQGLNTVYATARGAIDSVLFVSLPSQKQITVQPGVFTDNGVIIGKIFYDDDRNGYQSEGEVGVKGVELWMEDGTRITTGDDGKFSLPNVKPGQHVLRVNERSLPPRTELLKGGRDFAGDASSRFVRLPEGGIARANFFVKRVLRDSVNQKVGKVSKTAAMRTGSPRVLYLRNIPESNSQSNTVGFGVRINYSGTTWLQRIQVFDELPAGFTYVDGSATFNGRKVDPAVSGQELTWSLGRGSSLFEGALQYSVEVDRSAAQQTGLESRSYVELMTSDSVMIQTDTLKTSTTVQKIPFVESSFPVNKLVFNPGESTLRKDALKVFQPIINIIKKYHFADIMIVGYPDLPVKQGTPFATVQKLSEERANTAVDFLSRRIKLDSIHITACSVFRCDTSKDLLSSMMKTTPGEKKQPRHLEVRIQNYFANGLVTRDTGSSMSAISLVRRAPLSEKDFNDSLYVIPGDELVFRYRLFSNPSASVIDANIIDSTAGGISIGNESLTMNEIPIISAAQFKGVFSSSITPFVKKGKNELEFEATVPIDEQNNRINHLLYYERVNAFGETSIERSNVVTLYVKGINLSLLENALKNEKELAGTGENRKATTSK